MADLACFLAVRPKGRSYASHSARTFGKAADVSSALTARRQSASWVHRRGGIKQSLVTLLMAGSLCLGTSARGTSQQYQVYFGNLHSHTSYSDGVGTPAEAFDFGRREGKLDFMAITDHNHRMAESGASDDRKDNILIANDPTLYTGPAEAALIPTAGRFTEDGKFVALYGQEFSSISSGNHVNVFEISEVIDVPNGHFDQLVDPWLAIHPDSEGQKAIIQFNHPGVSGVRPGKEFGADDFGSTDAWVEALDPYVELLEVISGPAMEKDRSLRVRPTAEDEYLYYLHLGFHLAPTANQDNHYMTFGTVTEARTAVVATELTRPAILDALRNRRAYATEDRNLEVIARVAGALYGSRQPAPGQGTELPIEVSVRDADEPDARYTIQVLVGWIGQGPATVSVERHVRGRDVLRALRIGGIRYQGGFQYVLIKVKQEHENGPIDNAWLPPVWFEPRGKPALPETQELFRIAGRASDSEEALPSPEYIVTLLPPPDMLIGTSRRFGVKLIVKFPEPKLARQSEAERKYLAAVEKYLKSLSAQAKLEIAGATVIPGPEDPQPLNHGDITWWHVHVPTAGPQQGVVAVSFATRSGESTRKEPFEFHVRRGTDELIKLVLAVIGVVFGLPAFAVAVYKSGGWLLGRISNRKRRAGFDHS